MSMSYHVPLGHLWPGQIVVRKTDARLGRVIGPARTSRRRVLVAWSGYGSPVSAVDTDAVRRPTTHEMDRAHQWKAL